MAKIRSRAERTPQENEAISKKVELLLSEGYKIDQATAIAFRMFRDGELNILKETSQTYKRQREKKKSLLEQMKAAAALLGLDEILTNKKKK